MKPSKPVILLFSVTIVAIIGILANLTLRQIISLLIFSSIIAGTLSYWRYRLSFGLIGVSILLFFGLLDIPTLIKFAHFDIILFLIGMMTIVGFLEEAHFFEYLVYRIISLVGKNAGLLYATLLGMAAIFSALVDEVTAILFMIALTWEIARVYNTNPLNLILGVTFTTIIGGSATVVGDPVAIIVAFEGGLSMADFLYWATPITIVATLYIIGVTSLVFKDDIKDLQKNMTVLSVEEALEHFVKFEDVSLKASWVIFVGTIGSIVLHKQIADMLSYSLAMDISSDTMLVAISLFFSGIVLLLERERAHDLIIHKVDWWTLVFFIAFFSSVGTLKLVGITDLIAEAIINIASGEASKIFLLVSIIVGILSPLMDNVLTVAAFSPVVHSIAAKGINVFPMWWGLLFGGVFMALITPVGATASIVVLGLLERRKIGSIPMKDWVKVGLLTALPSFIFALAVLYIRFYIL
jgi:Na+/H+ antiporter NhaD/arsenite permease-like protein